MYKLSKRQQKNILTILLIALCFLLYIERRLEIYKQEEIIPIRRYLNYQIISSSEKHPIHRMFVKEKMRQYQYLLNQKYTPPENYINKYPNRIWVFWNSGFDKAPEIVKVCLNSIRKYSAGRIVETLDDKNFEKYIKLPGYIIQKYKEGKISKQGFANIVRTVLLRDYGGLWLDASYYLTGDIPQYIFDTELFAEIDFNHKSLDFSGDSTAFSVIENYILAANEPNTYFFKIMTDLQFAYWENHDIAPRWCWYALSAIAADDDLIIYRLIKNVYYLNRKHDFSSVKLWELFHEKFDEQEWSKIKNHHLHKITEDGRLKILKSEEDSFGRKLLRGELND